MSEREHSEVSEWLLENWTARLADSLESMLGERPEMTWSAATPSAAADVLWWEQPLSLGKQAVVWVGAPEASWLDLGSHILQGAGIEVTDPQDARNTYLEVLSQAFAGLVNAISRRVGNEITCGTGKESAAPPSEAATFDVNVTTSGKRLAALQLAFLPGLPELFGTELVPSGANALTGPAESGADPRQKGRGEGVPKTLELLMEIELPVSVSFGRAQLPLKDVIKLSTGSIVELNRAISEPVEVIVNNCVIARGEVVVVEGNYGVRIQEIISREKRLRTLQ